MGTKGTGLPETFLLTLKEKGIFSKKERNANGGGRVGLQAV